MSMTNLCVCDFWLSPQSAKPLVRTLKSVNYVLMNDLTQWLCEFCSRRRLLNTFTVKVTKHTVNSFKSIRSRWCLVTEDGVSLDISPQGTVTPYHLSHILNWLVNRLCVCACGCTTAGDFVRFLCAVEWKWCGVLTVPSLPPSPLIGCSVLSDRPVAPPSPQGYHWQWNWCCPCLNIYFCSY